MLENKRILVVVAHPDDEVLGLGAAMNKLIYQHNCTVRVVILGEGITSRSEKRDLQKWKDELLIHRKNINDAIKSIGYESVGIYDFPDNRFDTVALLDIIKVIENEKREFLPEIIFTHHGGDVNIDHQRTFEAVITASRPLTRETVKSIFTFETMSGTEWRASSDPRHFLPNYFIEISNSNLLAKVEAMEQYEFEKRPFPHPRSPEALKIRAEMWGVTVGVKMAEAFQLVRCIC
ncbi:PIG-L deacetylase family protein [Roseivirga sp.]|uniref:PIG-L deacetylase family protein n=1 Tax=Roseivirga sp. TaxID=1964215 RepID=UPI003B52C098